MSSISFCRLEKSADKTEGATRCISKIFEAKLWIYYILTNTFIIKRNKRNKIFFIV